MSPGRRWARVWHWQTRVPVLAALGGMATVPCLASAAQSPSPDTTVSRPAPAPASANVLARGTGATRDEATTAALRAAVERARGVLIASSTRISGEHLDEDRTVAASHGYVPRYTVVRVDSGDVGITVTVVAHVEGIDEPLAATVARQRTRVPASALLGAAALASAQQRAEGELLYELFARDVNRPGVYDYGVSAGSPVPLDGGRVRLDVLVTRVPNGRFPAEIASLRGVLRLLAGGDGAARIALDSAGRPRTPHWVHACVSICGTGDRRLLDIGPPLAPNDDFPRADPAVAATPAAAPVITLFPRLATVGGFAVAFPDSVMTGVDLYHLRATLGYVVVSDYARRMFDDAAFRLALLGTRDTVLATFTLRERFRASLGGAARCSLTVDRVHGGTATVDGCEFHQRTAGGPGTPWSSDLPYQILLLPAARALEPDSERVMLSLPRELAAHVATVTVTPLPVRYTHTLPDCRRREQWWLQVAQRWQFACDWPDGAAGVPADALAGAPDTLRPVRQP